VHAFIWPVLGVGGGHPTGAPPGSGLRHQAEELVAAAVAEADATRPGLRVSGEIIDGEAAAVLLRECPSTALIVLGDRGLGGFTALLVGSVAVQVAQYADCPVLVARGEEHPDGPVVVGIDAGPLSPATVDFAAETAALRGATLVALHAYRHPGSSGPGDMQPLVYDPEQLHGEEQRVLTGALDRVAERFPGVPVRHQALRGRPADVLTEASTGAQLVVVGAQGRSALGGLLGSVSQSVLHHAHCPVAMVRR
jgi:nucleotide-binding universal stress UspA family protein